MSESWKAPAAIIGIVTVLLTAAGIYISKQGSDSDRQHKQQVDEAQRIRQEEKEKEVKTRIDQLNGQLKQAEDQVQDFENKIQTTYRQIQDYDFKRKDPASNDPARAADNESYLIANQNLEIFSRSKKEAEDRRDALRREINELTKE